MPRICCEEIAAALVHAAAAERAIVVFSNVIPATEHLTTANVCRQTTAMLSVMSTDAFRIMEKSMKQFSTNIHADDGQHPIMLQPSDICYPLPKNNNKDF
jgi:hypothetical protein